MRKFRIASMVTCAAVLLIFEPAARADNMAYMATGSNNFGTLDLTTGAYTQIGSMGATLSGLGVFGGNIYGGLEGGITLEEVNPTTGAQTAVGTGTIGAGGGYSVFGSTLTGMFALDSNLFLWSVSPNGTTTLIGPTGLTNTGVAVGMSDNSSTLYVTDGAELDTVNTSTGLATPVGPTGGGVQIGALLFEGGTLYGGENQPGVLKVDTINVSTGAATVGPALSPNTFGNFHGLAPDPLPTAAVPEPGSLIFLVTCLALIGTARAVRSRARRERASTAFERGLLLALPFRRARRLSSNLF